MRTATEVSTLVGPLSFIWDDEALGVDAANRVCKGAVVSSAFVPLRKLTRHGATIVDADSTTGDLALVIAAVRAWSDGTNLNALDAVPVLQAGGEFRQRCWQQLRSVKAGDIVSYVELAARAGNAKASRAAGTAMATNTVAPFVPCHRVLRTDGRIGNYSATGGSETKATLLSHEGLEVS